MGTVPSIYPLRLKRMKILVVAFASLLLDTTNGAFSGNVYHNGDEQAELELGGFMFYVLCIASMD